MLTLDKPAKLELAALEALTWASWYQGNSPALLATGLMVT